MPFVEMVLTEDKTTWKLWAVIRQDAYNTTELLENFMNYAEGLGYSDMITTAMISYDNPRILVVFINDSAFQEGSAFEEWDDVTDLADVIRRWSGARKVHLGLSATAGGLKFASFPR